MKARLEIQLIQLPANFLVDDVVQLINDVLSIQISLAEIRFPIHVEKSNTQDEFSEFTLQFLELLF